MPTCFCIFVDVLGVYTSAEVKVPSLLPAVIRQRGASLNNRKDMANKPLLYTLIERKATLGKYAGKTVLQACPTGRRRIDHRNFCEEVARATTFKGAEVEAVLRLAAEIAKTHVENGDIVDFGDIGLLMPGFHSKLVEKGVEKFNANVHITKPVVRLKPSKRYFTLQGVSYERVDQKEKPQPSPSEPSTPGGGGGGGGL